MNRLSVLLLLFVLACTAQENKEKSVLEKMIEPRISYESAYLDAARVAHTKGNVSVYKNRLQLNNELVSLSYSNWKFVWDDVSQLPFGDALHTPIEQIHAIQASVNIPKKLGDDWFLLASFSLKSTFEEQMQDSYGVNLFGFASYRIDEDHSVQMGAFANYHPTSTLALPVVSYGYRQKQKDGWQFTLGFPRTYVGYHINEKSLVRFGLMYSQSLVRLSDASVIERSGYAEAKDYMSNLGITYQLGDALKFSGDLLYSLSREFIIYDAHANQVQHSTIERSFGIDMRIVYSLQ